jgi:hypothetical protein
MNHLKSIKYIRIKFKEKNWKVEFKKKKKKKFEKKLRHFIVYINNITS